jgi:hypothetical protein
VTLSSGAGAPPSFGDYVALSGTPTLLTGANGFSAGTSGLSIQNTSTDTLLVQAHASIVLTQGTNKILRVIFYKNSSPINASEKESPTTSAVNLVELTTEALVELAPEDVLSLRVTSVNSTDVITASLGSLIVGTIGRQGTPGPKGDKGDQGDPGVGSGSPGGANQQIQFNDGGEFGGTSGLVFDSTTVCVGINNLSPTSRLDIVGQNALRLTGVQPFFVMRDSNDSNKGFRFQTISGNAILSTDIVGDGSFLEKFRFSNDGQLGIGTNAPGASVHIVRSDLGACLWIRHTGPTNAAVFIDAAGPNTVDRPVLVMRKNTDNCYILSCDGLSIGTVYHEVPGVNGRHIILANGVERFRIDTTGIKSSGHIAGSYSLLTANSTSMPFASFTVVQLPVSAPLTLTSTVPAAGTICFLIIETQGTNSRTVNFNTSQFFVAGVVNTGAVAGKTFTLTFISNGNRLIETGRAGPAG